MRSRRFLFVLIVGVLVASALVAGRASSTPPAPVVGAKIAPNAAVLAESSTVWFCPGLPTALPAPTGRVTFANIGATAAQVVVTDLADNGHVTHATLDVAPDSIVTKVRATLGRPGSLTVETFGGRVLVEEGVEGPGAVDGTPCATQASQHWYFAAGATPRGEQQWLVIDNPYASDARVDITLRTSSGVRKPDALQGLDIARRSREVIAIHNIAVRESRVAISIDAAVGSVVAEQALVFTSDAGAPGVALSIGAPEAATEWTFESGLVEPGSTALVAIVNVGGDAAQVDVQATAVAPKPPLVPTSLTIAQDDVVWVLLGHCAAAAGRPCVDVPERSRFTLDVRSEQHVSIVAQTLARFGDAPDLVGTVTSPGELAPARSWAFARSQVSGGRATTLTFFNPAAAPSVVRVGLVHDGVVDHPGPLRKVTVAPGRAMTVVIFGVSKPATTDAALTIDATEPVFVERSIIATGEAVTSVGVVVG